MILLYASKCPLSQMEEKLPHVVSYRKQHQKGSYLFLLCQRKVIKNKFISYLLTSSVRQQGVKWPNHH